MADGEDWLLRPVLRGLCRYESLQETLLTLEDFLIMNEAIDVEVENQDRWRKANHG